MISMEAYSDITCFLGLAAVPVSIVAGIVHAAWKRTPRYLWLFGCIAGYCFFTSLIHLDFSLSYDDISSPNYEIYEDWNLYRFILSDVKRLIFWLGIGVLNYFAFVRQNKWIRRLCILAGGIAIILFLAIMVLCRVTTVDVPAHNF
ncbi:hypothetical protein D3Z51_16855 [Clostridiaceae bacterium]|nr:hypothetical protein [Clostridiaceae bacterium]RKI10204.1 hypothetical protein D7V81_16315 [bacterium 1XD21-70]